MNEDTAAGVEGEPAHEWRFKLGEAFPADDPVARFVVAVGGALNDNLVSHTAFVEVQDEHDQRLMYFFRLASSHLYEAAEAFRTAHSQWQEVRDFVGGLDQARKDEFVRIIALADQNPPWPGKRLKDIRNSFFHYMRLERAAYDAGRLPVALGLQDAAELECTLVSEPGSVLTGIWAQFADQVILSALTVDYEDDELRRLIEALANYQADLNRFTQAALGRYLRERPEGIVIYERRNAAADEQDDRR